MVSTQNDILENRPIFCMEHCKDYKLFGFSIPSKCSHCGTNLTNDVDLHIPPFRIPIPFVSASDCPCAIVLKPTKGSYLKDYKNSDNLHIGVTSSSGIVYEYNYDGLRNDKTSEWTQCVPVQNIFSNSKLRKNTVPKAHNVCHVHNNESLIRKHWDSTLLGISSSSFSNEWTSERYNEWTHNCYSFILYFLQQLYQQLISNYSIRTIQMDYDSISTMDKFCESYILEKTKSASKYITLYRQLCNK